MKKVNFAVEVKGLTGEKVVANGVEIKLPEYVGNTLVMQKAQDPVRQKKLAETIYFSNGPIELEDADYQLLKKAIKGSDHSCLIGAVIEEVFAKAEEKKKEKKG